MFKIYDGREHFFQWDLEQRLVVSDASVNEVHFCNKTDDCSLRREVYELDGQRVVDVPNILFQDEMPLKVYAYCTNYTKVCATFKIHARTKPENYIYTDDEVLTWEQLNERINQIEEHGISDEAVEAAVGKYLDENPIETGATEQEAAQIEQNKNDIATINKTMATTEYVDKAVENVDVDLTGYATEKYVDDAIANIDIPEGEGGESIKEIAISTTEPTDENIVLWINPNETGEDFATKEYVEERDGVVLTAAKEYTDEKVEGIVIPDVSNFATKSEIPDTSNFATKSEIPDVSGFTTMAAVEAKGYTTMPEVEAKGYQTESQVNALIAAAGGGGGGGGGEAEDYYIKNPNSLTAEDKVFLEEFYAYYVANGKTMCEIYIQQPGTTTMHLATYVSFGSLRLLLYYVTTTAHSFEGLSVNFNSDGSFQSASSGSMGNEIGWSWDGSTSWPLYVNGKIMKIQCYWTDNTEKLFNLEVTGEQGGNIGSYGNFTHTFVVPRNGQPTVVQLYNDWGSFSIQDGEGNDISGDVGLNGYWYWM